MTKKIKVEKKIKVNYSQREYDKFSTYAELLNVDIPKGEHVSTYSYSNAIKYFHS